MASLPISSAVYCENVRLALGEDADHTANVLLVDLPRRQALVAGIGEKLLRQRRGNDPVRKLRLCGRGRLRLRGLRPLLCLRHILLGKRRLRLLGLLRLVHLADGADRRRQRGASERRDQRDSRKQQKDFSPCFFIRYGGAVDIRLRSLRLRCLRLCRTLHRLRLRHFVL